MRHERFCFQVAEQCKEYAAKHDCSLLEALYEWEGDGPEGSFGLTKYETETVAAMLGKPEEG